MIVDPYGNPVTIAGRRRMGFMGGDLLLDHDTVSNVTPPERAYMLGHGSDQTLGGDNEPDTQAAASRDSRGTGHP